MKICLVCSSGGHFFELNCLNSAWEGQESFWVTFNNSDTQRILDDKKWYAAYFPTNRNILNLIRNLWLAQRILQTEKPQVIISTGAGVCLPFFLLAKFKGIKTIYIESMARIHSLSLTGRLIYPLADEFIVQWPELETVYKKAVFKGQVL